MVLCANTHHAGPMGTTRGGPWDHMNNYKGNSADPSACESLLSRFAFAAFAFGSAFVFTSFLRPVVKGAKPPVVPPDAPSGGEGGGCPPPHRPRNRLGIAPEPPPTIPRRSSTAQDHQDCLKTSQRPRPGPPQDRPKYPKNGSKLAVKPVQYWYSC